MTKPPAPNAYEGAPNPWPPPGTWWLTRDSDAITGELMDVVEVWVAPPHRHRMPAYGALRASAAWYSAPEGWDLSTRWGSYAVGGMRAWLGVIPETDRECVRVG